VLAVTHVGRRRKRAEMVMVFVGNDPERIGLEFSGTSSALDGTAPVQ
jgi:hypothetical protein